VAGLIDPKSRSGRRVPIAAALRGHLVAHRLRGPGADGFVFSGPDGRPFGSARQSARAKEAWRQAGLQPVGLHECRHTYASLMITAGLNAKALSTYMGHSSITVTLDRYGHLLPGYEREAGTIDRSCSLRQGL
jgi:integrase